MDCGNIQEKSVNPKVKKEQIEDNDHGNKDLPKQTFWQWLISLIGFGEAKDKRAAYQTKEGKLASEEETKQAKQVAVVENRNETSQEGTQSSGKGTGNEQETSEAAAGEKESKKEGKGASKKKKKRGRSKSPETKSRGQLLGKPLNPPQVVKQVPASPVKVQQQEKPAEQEEKESDQSLPTRKRYPISKNFSSVKYLIPYSPSHEQEIGCQFEFRGSKRGRQPDSSPSKPFTRSMSCPACPPPPPCNPCACYNTKPCCAASITSLMRSRCPAPLIDKKKCRSRPESAPERGRKGKGCKSQKKGHKHECGPPCPPCQTCCGPPPIVLPCRLCPPPCPPPCPRCQPPCPQCPGPCMPPSSPVKCQATAPCSVPKYASRTSTTPTPSSRTMQSCGSSRAGGCCSPSRKKCGSHRAPTKVPNCKPILPVEPPCQSGGCPVTCMRPCCVPTTMTVSGSCPAKIPCCPSSQPPCGKYHSICGYKKPLPIAVSTYCNPKAIKSYAKSRDNDALCKYLMNKYNVPPPEYPAPCPMTLDMCQPVPRLSAKVKDLELRGCHGRKSSSGSACKQSTMNFKRESSKCAQACFPNIPLPTCGQQPRDEPVVEEGNKTQNYQQEVSAPETCRERPVVYNTSPSKTEPRIAFTLSKRTPVECLREKGPRSPTKDFISKVGLPNKKKSPKKNENAELEEGSSGVSTSPKGKSPKGKATQSVKGEIETPAQNNDEEASKNVSDNKANPDGKTKVNKSSDSRSKNASERSSRTKSWAKAIPSVCWPVYNTSNDRYMIKNSSFHRSFLSLSLTSSTSDSVNSSNFVDDVEPDAENQVPPNSGCCQDCSTSPPVGPSDQHNKDEYKNNSVKIGDFPCISEENSVVSMSTSDLSIASKKEPNYQQQSCIRSPEDCSGVTEGLVTLGKVTEHENLTMPHVSNQSEILSHMARSPRKQLSGTNVVFRNASVSPQRARNGRQRSRSMSPGHRRREDMPTGLSYNSRHSSRSRSPPSRHRSKSPMNRRSISPGNAVTLSTAANKWTIWENDGEVEDSMAPCPEPCPKINPEASESKEKVDSKDCPPVKEVVLDDFPDTLGVQTLDLLHGIESMNEAQLPGLSGEKISNATNSLSHDEVNELTKACEQVLGYNSEQSLLNASNKIVSTHPTITTTPPPHRFACLSSDCRLQGESSVDPQDYDFNRESCVDPSCCKAEDDKVTSLHSMVGTCVDFAQPLTHGERKPACPFAEPDMYTHQPPIGSSIDGNNHAVSHLKQGDEHEEANNSNNGDPQAENNAPENQIIESAGASVDPCVLVTSDDVQETRKLVLVPQELENSCLENQPLVIDTVSENAQEECHNVTSESDGDKCQPEEENTKTDEDNSGSATGFNPMLGRITSSSKLHELLMTSGVKWQKVGPATPADIKILHLAKNAYKGIRNGSSDDTGDGKEGKEEGEGEKESTCKGASGAFMNMFKSVDDKGESRPLQEEFVKSKEELECGSILSRIKDL